LELQGDSLLAIVGRSLAVSGSALAIAVGLGLPLGIALAMCRFPGRSLLIAVVRAGMALPPVVVGLAIYLLLSRSGPLGGLGWLFTVRAMILAQTALALPFVIGGTQLALQSLPAELAAQIQSLGATPRQIRWTLLREALPGIVFAVAIALGRSISEVGAVLLVGGNIQGQTRVMTTAIILETNQGRFEVALALGCCLLAIALATNLLLVMLVARQNARGTL
jgi:tungstate transport system permease protein